MLSIPRTAWILAGPAVILLLGATPSLAQHPAPAQGFDAFKMVRTRNIFDPDRRPPPSENGASAASAAPIAQSDYVALTGTLITGDKALAFFSGSRGDFDKVLPVKEKIAGVTITKISPNGITIDRAGKTSTIAVGWTLPLNGAASAPAPMSAEAAPALPAFGTVAPVAAAAAPGAAGAIANPAVSPAPGATPPVPAPNEDVARMMRQRRQQEMQ
jgi:hypothetical protein